MTTSGSVAIKQTNKKNGEAKQQTLKRGKSSNVSSLLQVLIWSRFVK